MQEIPTIVLVVAVALLDGEGRVLLQQRRADRVHGGLWEFPGGKVEATETLGQALVREIEEELAIVLDPDELVPFGFSTGANQPHVILLYTCRTWRGEPECRDAARLGWFSADQLCALDLVALDVPLARQLREELVRTN